MLESLHQTLAIFKRRILMRVMDIIYVNAKYIYNIQIINAINWIVQ